MSSCLYQLLEDKLEDLECPDCSGLGEIDDADFGDISYNIYVCKSCRGTGFKKGRVFTLKEST